MCRKLAATKTITSIRDQRAAIVKARRRWRRHEFRTTGGSSGRIGIGVVRAGCAMVRLRKIIRSDFQRIALIVPIAVVIARSCIAVVLAIRETWRWLRTRNATIKSVLGIVTCTRAFGIIRVHTSVTIIVDPIAAHVYLRETRSGCRAVARGSAIASVSPSTAIASNSAVASCSSSSSHPSRTPAAHAGCIR